MEVSVLCVFSLLLCWVGEGGVVGLVLWWLVWWVWGDLDMVLFKVL